MRIFIVYLCLFQVSSHTCFQRIFNKGIEDFNKGKVLCLKGMDVEAKEKFREATNRWKAALGCPHVKPSEQLILSQWYELAQEYYYSRDCRLVNGRAHRFVEKLAFLPTLDRDSLQWKAAIDWTGNYVETVGISVIDKEKYPDSVQAISMATRAAEKIAYTNLLEISRMVRVRRTATIQDLIDSDNAARDAVESLVRSIRQFDPPIVTDQTVQVRAWLPIYGLTPLSRRSTVLPHPSDTSFARPNPVTWILPALNSDEPDLQLNFDDNRFDPALALVLVDSIGHELFDFSNVVGTKQGFGLFTTSPNLSVPARQNPDGTISILSKNAEQLFLQYLKARAEKEEKAAPYVLFYNPLMLAINPNGITPKRN